MVRECELLLKVNSWCTHGSTTSIEVFQSSSNCNSRSFNWWSAGYAGAVELLDIYFEQVLIFFGVPVQGSRDGFAQDDHLMSSTHCCRIFESKNTQNDKSNIVFKSLSTSFSWQICLSACKYRVQYLPHDDSICLKLAGAPIMQVRTALIIV